MKSCLRLGSWLYFLVLKGFLGYWLLFFFVFYCQGTIFYLDLIFFLFFPLYLQVISSSDLLCQTGIASWGCFKLFLPLHQHITKLMMINMFFLLHFFHLDSTTAIFLLIFVDVRMHPDHKIVQKLIRIGIVRLQLRFIGVETV